MERLKSLYLPKERVISVMSEPSREEQQVHSMDIPIEWHIPDSIQSRYASNVFVQAGQYEIVLSFFETQLPIFTGSTEENKAKLEQMGAVQAECVGRIIVDPDVVPNLIKALQRGLDIYRASKLRAEGEISR